MRIYEKNNKYWQKKFQEFKKNKMKKNSQIKYNKSINFSKKAEAFIPGGAQTFSKSKVHLPEDHSPLVISRASGYFTWDIDGNKYIDLINGLLCVLLGHKFNETDKSIKNQMKKGISFSLSSDLEYKLAKKMVEIIPSAEMVRFAKNGTDVNSAAIRVARAFTKKDIVLVCGYHGWQDWYIGSTVRDIGVPDKVKGLTKKIKYNDIEDLKKKIFENKNNISCLIMEPLQGNGPKKNYLEEVRKICTKEKIILIFDEIITGFRISVGGAQEYFNVVPDLSTFGKGLGNGMPISAIVGKKNIMKLFEDVFFSGTFGGECLSLAAGLTVVDVVKENNVPQHLWTLGETLKLGIMQSLEKHNLSTFINLVGLPPWLIFNFNGKKHFSSSMIKTFFLKECFSSGLLTLGSNNLSYSMTLKTIKKITKIYDNIFSKLSYIIFEDQITELKKIPEIRPVFSIRK